MLTNHDTRLRAPSLIVAAAMLLAVGPALAGGDPARGQAKSAVCAACHGADGNSPSPEFPRIGGQHEDYLFQALRAYQLGSRKNPVMAAQVENLTQDDLRDLAAWYANQPGLYVKR
jgi:cytochrome c553